MAIQEQLKPLGVEVSLFNTDAKTHYDFLDNNGDYDLARAAWIADYGDPETFLGISITGAGKNYSRYHSEKFDGLMKEAAATTGDPAKRFEVLSQAERVLVDDVGNIPVMYYSFKNAVSNKIAGWEDNVMDRHPSRFITKTE